nr:olfactory receptor 10 [Matsumurasca onukii]
MREFCTTEEDTSKFVHDFVTHHLHIKRVITILSKVHKYVFMTQYVFTTSHSCFLAFSFYYCDELFRALYECPWYKCPRSFKTSLTIMLEFYRRRVTLNGGSFTATLHTFLQGLQQSVSYILILKQLTPEHQK